MPWYLQKNYDSAALNERDEIFLTLTSLKYLVRDNKVRVDWRKYWERAAKTIMVWNK